MQAFPETMINELVCREEVASKILRHKDDADNYARDQISKNELQKAEIAIVGKAGNADHRQSAGFCRHNGKRNCPPGDVAIGKEIAFQRTIGGAEMNPKERDAEQINREQCEVESVESHAGGAS